MLSIVMFQAMIKEVILSPIQRKREKARRNKVFNSYVVMMYFSETWKIVLAIENHCNYGHYGKKSAPISFTSCTSFNVIASFAVLNAYFLHSFSLLHFVQCFCLPFRRQLAVYCVFQMLSKKLREEIFTKGQTVHFGAKFFFCVASAQNYKLCITFKFGKLKELNSKQRVGYCWILREGKK